MVSSYLGPPEDSNIQQWSSNILVVYVQCLSGQMLPKKKKNDQIRNHQLHRHDMTMCEESEDLEDSRGSRGSMVAFLASKDWDLVGC